VGGGTWWSCETGRRDGGGPARLLHLHAGPDSAWAEWIGQQFEGAGYTVELDVWEWSAGIDFVAAMERALGRAARVVAVRFGGMVTAAASSSPARHLPDA
jgi:TIR domain